MDNKVTEVKIPVPAGENPKEVESIQQSAAAIEAQAGDPSDPTPTPQTTPIVPETPRDPVITPEAAVSVSDPTKLQQQPSDTVDSLGEKKTDEGKIGPRGDEDVVHIPRGFKPEPETQTPVVTTSDNVDSAGSEKDEHVPGPKHTAETGKVGFGDTFRR